MKKQSEQTAHHELLKQVNIAAVYRIIDTCGPISRVSIAHESNLAPASITNITRLLLEQGLIRETDQEVSTGGRRAISLVTVKTDFVFISCRLGREELQCSLMDLSGKIAYHQSQPLTVHSAPQLLDTLIQTIREVRDLHAGARRCIGLAVTMAGLIDSDNGRIIYSPNHQLEDIPLASQLEEQLHLPVFLGNDTRASALAEYYFGAAQSCQDFILVSIHQGLGAGIVSHGNLLMGGHRNIGEIGHIQLEPFGEQCHCGHFGCAETLVSNPAIIRKVESLLQKGHHSKMTAPVNIQTLCEAFIQHDPLAIHVFQQTGDYLGRLLSIMVNLFNPEKIFLAGEIMCAESILLPAVQQQISRTVLPNFASGLQLERAAFQKQSTLGGYAMIKKALHEDNLLQQIMMSNRSADLQFESEKTAND